jgi:hypothetical protein
LKGLDANEEFKMSANDASFISTFLVCALLTFVPLGCTNKQGREPVVEQPVASPTSTIQPSLGNEPEPGASPVGGADVPFDGSKPEALGTALPGVSSTPSSAQREGIVFNVYSELLKSSLTCEEAKP